MVIAYHREKFTPLLSNGNLPDYHSIIIHGKISLTTILQLSIKLLDLVIPLTFFILSVIFGISKEMLSLVIYT